MLYVFSVPLYDIKTFDFKITHSERRGGRERKREKQYFINPSKSSMVREHSLHKPSVIKSSGVSVPRTAMTTVFRSCKTTTK